MGKFRDDVQKLVDDRVASAADGNFCPHDVLRLAADVCELAATSARGIAAEDDASFDALVVDVEWAVQEYLVKFDLGRLGVPKWIERVVVDPQLVPAVRPALELLRPKPHVNE